MAIAFGSGHLEESSGYVNSLTDSSLNISGSGRTLVTVVGSRDSDVVTGITHDGTALTKQAESHNANVCGATLWTLESPTAGTNNIILSASGYKLFSMYSFFLTGAGGVEATNGGNTNYGAAPSNAITTLTNNAWVIDAVNLQGAATIAANSGQTERNNSDHSDSNLGQLGVATEPQPTAGSETQGWTWTGDDNWAHALIVIKEAIASTYTPQIITVN